MKGLEIKTNVQIYFYEHPIFLQVLGAERRHGTLQFFIRRNKKLARGGRNKNVSLIAIKEPSPLTTYDVGLNVSRGKLQGQTLLGWRGLSLTSDGCGIGRYALIYFPWKKKSMGKLAFAVHLFTLIVEKQAKNRLLAGEERR